MRTTSRRSITALAPAIVAAVAITLMPASAAAATTRNVTMNDGYSYTPSSVTAALGDKVKWTNNAVLQSNKHDVNTSHPNHLFSSGGAGSIHPGNAYSYTFTSAGTFPYFCIFHASDHMKGTVTVPMKVKRVAGSSPERFKITVGSVALASSAPWVRVVQVDLPGGGATYTVIKTTRAASFKYKPASHGTYRFRSYLKSTGSNGQSQTSPVVSISH
jgi:plastocyanin